MQPLPIGDHTFSIELPHILVTQDHVNAAALGTTEGTQVRMAYLGVCLRGEGKPRHRLPHEPATAYGQHVYDHLRALGASHDDMQVWSMDVMAEAINIQQLIPSEEQVRDAGEASGEATLADASSSASDTAETLSNGSK